MSPGVCRWVSDPLADSFPTRNHFCTSRRSASGFSWIRINQHFCKCPHSFGRVASPRSSRCSVLLLRCESSWEEVRSEQFDTLKNNISLFLWGWDRVNETRDRSYFASSLKHILSGSLSRRHRCSRNLDFFFFFKSFVQFFFPLTNNECSVFDSEERQLV